MVCVGRCVEGLKQCQRLEVGIVMERVRVRVITASASKTVGPMTSDRVCRQSPASPTEFPAPSSFQAPTGNLKLQILRPQFWPDTNV